MKWLIKTLRSATSEELINSFGDLAPGLLLGMVILVDELWLQVLSSVAFIHLFIVSILHHVVRRQLYERQIERGNKWREAYEASNLSSASVISSLLGQKH